MVRTVMLVKILVLSDCLGKMPITVTIISRSSVI
jgi:hypothetical protein